MSQDQDAREERVKLWGSGIDLNTAWTRFGDERQLKLQIEHQGTPVSMVYQRLIMQGVFSNLVSGDLISMGYRMAPTLSDGPIEIPADTFDQRLPASWEENAVEASGWRYERIRVLDPAELPDLAIAPEPVLVGSDQDTKTSALEASKLGRKSTYEACARALDLLSDELVALPSDAIYDHFVEAFRKANKKVLSKIRPPTARTLRKHLPRYRSERNGRNRKK
jgi:hypothetical protein